MAAGSSQAVGGNAAMTMAAETMTTSVVGKTIRQDPSKGFYISAHARISFVHQDGPAPRCW